MAKKNDWVRVHSIVLEPEMRALAALPADTQKVPLEMWVKGHLTEDAQIGELVTVTTQTGRIVSGILEEESPCYTHSFGAFVPELQQAGDALVAFLRGGEQHA